MQLQFVREMNKWRYIYIYIYIYGPTPQRWGCMYTYPLPPLYPSSARRINLFYLRFVSSKTAISQMLICLSGRCCSMLILWPLTLGSQKNKVVRIPAMLCKPGKHSDSSPSIGPRRITNSHNIFTVYIYIANIFDYIIM